MAKGFNQLQISPAVNAVSNFNLDSQHMTTMDFGQLSILYHKAMIPRDKIQYKHQIFSRVAPMVFPTYGNMQIRTVSGFVPYYQLFEGVENFFSGNKTTAGVYNAIPVITLSDFCNSFVNVSSYPIDGDEISMTTVVDTVPIPEYDSSSGNFDFCVFSDDRDNLSDPLSVSVSTYLFNNSGRKVYKLLNQLGYFLPSGICFRANSKFRSYADTTYLNALPILAFLKFYNDWMSQSSVYDSSELTRYLFCIKTRTQGNFNSDPSLKFFVSDPQSPNTGKIFLNPAALFYVLSQVEVMFDSDYLTSAWRYPNSVVDNNNNINASLSVPGNSVSYIGGTSNQNYIDVELDQDMSTIPALGLRMLQSFDRWVRRNNYSGSRDINRLYARFGIEVDNLRSNYSYVLSKDSIPVQVGDVTNLTESSNSDVPLGSYAGKGLVNGQGSCNFESGDYGMFFTVGYVYARPVYYRAYDRENLKVNTFDFYNPDFDGIGPEAISFLEVDCNGKIAKSVPQNTVFGFTERYNDMRFSKDQITGDFLRFKDMEAWHLGRDMSFISANGIKAQSRAVVMQDVDENGNSEFDRIFALTATDKYNAVDHFYLQCNFDVKMQRPMKNFSQAVDLGDGSLNLNRNGVQQL